MRWLWLLIAMLSFAAVFQVSEAWMVAVALLVGFASLVAAFFAFASARVSAVSQDQATKATDILMAAQGVAAAKRNQEAAAAARRAQVAPAPPPARPLGKGPTAPGG